ncbi:MAG: hypothetical protein EOP17_13975 [Rhizobiaceae bacterium]|nr:MAG: hypothetical protein EOP17_13975 [Rhizobiaceae bacterium]
MSFSWMAWTLPTTLFFVTIFALIAAMGIWEYFSPGGAPRVGILRFETTRGDRLFISLLGAAFINLAWLGLIGRRAGKGAAMVHRCGEALLRSRHQGRLGNADHA